jgi:hypothetical protein
VSGLIRTRDGGWKVRPIVDVEEAARSRTSVHRAALSASLDDFAHRDCGTILRPIRTGNMLSWDDSRSGRSILRAATLKLTLELRPSAKAIAFDQSRARCLVCALCPTVV